MPRTYTQLTFCIQKENVILRLHLHLRNTAMVVNLKIKEIRKGGMSRKSFYLSRTGTATVARTVGMYQNNVRKL